jgi:YHS domain-containing protein
MFMGEAEESGLPAVDPMPPDPDLEERPKAMVRDPVCGKAVDPAGAAAMVDHQGVPYLFCSLVCKAAFEMEPVRYVG